ncbi:hypothetical protein HYC85_003086 [Camellia sinensis]|uniref:AAA+ ATPase domain-containing protein n=1 Tax=Camellia sinensis TaxID=4442 RepID=A0A7J7IBA9_CAMSI|nr:hypothetical protein HYC85_003086 [Camellia sinensis]
MIAAISWVPKGVSRSIPAVAETPSKEEIKEILNSRTFERSFGLIFGRSGSGKTTLLQLIAGLTKPTSRSIYIQRYDNDGKPNQSPEQLTPERVGIVQIPNLLILDEPLAGLGMNGHTPHQNFQWLRAKMMSWGEARSREDLVARATRNRKSSLERRNLARAKNSMLQVCNPEARSSDRILARAKNSKTYTSLARAKKI